MQTYDLKFPITQKFRNTDGVVREEVVETVTVRRVRAKDLRSLDKHEGKFGQSLAMISALTGLPLTVIDELDAADIEGLGEIIGDFLPTRQETGEPS
jgi:hypothetical protein